MGSSNEPGAVSWATGASSPDIVVPPAGNQVAGFAALDPPPYSWVNWFWNRAAAWVTYLASQLSYSFDTHVVEGYGDELELVQVPSATLVTVSSGRAVVGGLGVKRQVEVTAPENVTVPAAGTAGVGEFIIHRIAIDNTGAVSVVDSTTYPTALATIALDVASREGALADLAPDYALLGYAVDENGLAQYATANLYDRRQLRPVSGRIIEEGTIDEDHLSFPVYNLAVTIGAEDAGHDRAVTIAVEDVDGNPVTEVKRVWLTALGPAGQRASDVANAPLLGSGTGPPVTGARVSQLGIDHAIFDTDSSGLLEFVWAGSASTTGEFFLLARVVDDGPSVVRERSATWS